MKRFVVFPLAALAFAAACVDTPTESAMLAGDAAVLSAGGIANTNNGPVWVTAEFTYEIVLGGGGGSADALPGVNMHPRAGSPEGGTCRMADGTVSGNQADNTSWFNSQGRVRTSAWFCRGSAGGSVDEVVTVTCEIDALPATYAAGSGNESLNFDPDMFVRYRGRQNDTRGTGTIGVSYACDNGDEGTGTLDLTRFSSPNSNLFISPPVDRGLTPVSAALTLSSTPDGYQAGTLTLTELAWLFRERVGA